MPSPLRLALAALLTLAGTGCQNTYLGRYAALRSIDVEDHRRLPWRPIAAAVGTVPLPRAPDTGWVARVGVGVGDQQVRSSASLDSLLDVTGTTAFIVMHAGQVLDERYRGGAGPDSLFKAFSISKSILSALIGIAEQAGHLRTSDTVGAYLALSGNPAVAHLTVQQLIDNVGGFRYRRGNAPWKDQPRMYYSSDIRRLVAGVRVVHPPGTRFDADDFSPLLAASVLEQALQRAGADSTLSHYAQVMLWQPMGATHDAHWNIDHAPDGLEKAESGFVATALDLARFGQLYLDGGMAHGRAVVPTAWVERSTSPPPSGAPNLFRDGFLHNLWWGRTPPGSPTSDAYANGHFGQRIYVARRKGLVLVRLGRRSGGVDWTAVLGGIADRW